MLRHLSLILKSIHECLSASGNLDHMYKQVAGQVT